ncbi:hypothetical protein, partial [Hyalangium versicolor]|uniref:hypothetical protein n=1 Tax=Hyalangium versicolor TaxID=2861190 RepID=UPI001CCEF8F3
DNTATVLTLPGVVTGQAPTVGASYAIREVGTTINGMLSMAPTPISTPAATALANAAWILDGPPVATAGSSEGRLTVQQFAYGASVTRAFGIYTDVGLLVRRNRFAQTVANARALVLNRAGSVVARDNSVSMSSSGGVVEQMQGSNARSIDLQNNVVDGCGNVTLVGPVAYYRTTGNSVVGAARIHHIGTVLDGQVSNDKYSGTTAECILGNAATADGTVGQLSVINTSFGSCAGGVINVNGP